MSDENNDNEGDQGARQAPPDPEFRPMTISTDPAGNYLLSVQTPAEKIVLRRTPEQLAIMASGIVDTLEQDNVDIPEL